MIRAVDPSGPIDRSGKLPVVEMSGSMGVRDMWQGILGD